MAVLNILCPHDPGLGALLGPRCREYRLNAPPVAGNSAAESRPAGTKGGGNVACEDTSGYWNPVAAAAGAARKGAAAAAAEVSGLYDTEAERKEAEEDDEEGKLPAAAAAWCVNGEGIRRSSIVAAPYTADWSSSSMLRGSSQWINKRGKKSHPIRIRRAESNPPLEHERSGGANSPETSRRRFPRPARAFLRGE
uniref:Uncharacterized protein n=1 Tax=Oryza punctata TaxID=4537 RepID=A0A0E0JF65_ORYPU